MLKGTLKEKLNIALQFLKKDTSIVAVFFATITLVISYTAFRIKYLSSNLFWGIVCFFLSCALCSVIAYFTTKKVGGINSVARVLKDNKFVFLSGIITAVVLLFAFVVYGIFPFGKYTVLRMDLYHQYGPMFGELYDKIIAKDSLLYSFNSGGGSSFLGNFFNYLSSPVSLLIFWFNRKCLADSIAYMILVKCALSATSFCYYLKKRYSISDLSQVAFSLLYAFCSYFIAYYWNLMWLDAVALLPLVFLGIERVVDKNKFGLYTTALTLTLITNYYMGYMVCIFSVVYFFFHFFSNNSPSAKYNPSEEANSFVKKALQNKLLRVGFSFAIGSILAGLLSAFVLIPVLFTLRSSNATNSTFPDSFEFYFNIFDFVANHLPSVKPTIRSSGDGVQPNVYCGLLTVMLLPLYALSKKISWREKVANIVLLALFLVCFNTNFANYILHGFHFPNDLPYRFSFIYSFVLLTMAYKVFRNYREFNKNVIIATGIGTFALILLVQKLGTEYSDSMTIYVSLAFCALYTLLLLAIVSKKIAASLVGIVLVCTTVTEVLVADIPRLNFSVTRDSYTQYYDDYKTCLSQLKQQDNSAYRVEVSGVDNLLRMSPCWYNYKGINCFSSMEYEQMAQLQFRLGMFGNKINSFTYYTQTPVYNAMFGLKYVITNTDEIPLNKNLYTKVGKDVGKLKTYENKYTLPLAFAVNSTVTNYWETNLNNPFEVQNDFVKEATGIKEDVFKRIDVDLGVCNNCYMTAFDYTSQSDFKVNNTDAYANFTTMFSAPEKANVYLYYGTRSLESIDVTTSNYSVTQTIGVEPYILDLGVLERNEDVSVVANIDGESDEGWFRTAVYYLDQEVLDKAYEKLNDSGAMSVTKFTNTCLEGTVSLESGEILYSSIPYDQGWSVTVDGKPAKTVKVCNTLLGVKTETGTHLVKFTYFPKGLGIGLTTSGLTLCFLLGYITIKKRREKSKN